MDWSEEDQKVAVSAASAMSLKRSISSLDLAADARAARARHSSQPSNKEGLEDPTLDAARRQKMKELAQRIKVHMLSLKRAAEQAAGKKLTSS